MEYTQIHLFTFFFIYSFLGWCLEVGTMAVKERKFCNRGFLNAPLCMSYGIIMNVLLIMLPTLNENFLLQLIACIVVEAAVEYLAGEAAKRVSGNKLWNYDSKSIFGGEKRGFVISAAIGIGILLTVYIVHPVIFFLLQMVPAFLVQIILGVCSFMLLCDFISVYCVLQKRKKSSYIESFELEIKENKFKIGKKIYRTIWSRLERAYPDLKKQSVEYEKNYTFAKGVCFDKLIWIFLLCAFAGDIIETLYMKGTTGIWMSRSSVIYGPFSIVWGIGAVLLTIVLQKLAKKEDRYVFLGGFFLGGTYEYLCSVFTEVFMGTTFWDYSHLPFNIGGRTNLLFCVFWGALALVWVKLCYPYISNWIEKIPPVAGKIITWTACILMICNMIISMLAITRYTDRKEQKNPANIVEKFLDYHYPDTLVEFVWPYMEVK